MSCTFGNNGDSNKPRHVPTPAQIKARAAKIREGWSDTLKRSKLMLKNPEASIPVCSESRFNRNKQIKDI